MKKALIIFVSVIIVLLGILVSLPYFFKDDIKAAIDEELAASVNADINFDIENFDISIFPNFPNLTVGIQDFSVVGRDDFAGNVLFSTQNFEVVINLKKIIFDDQMSVQGILLDHPIIWIKVLANGKANYDIAIPSEEVEEIEEDSEEPSEPFKMSIEKWQIIGGDVTYDDETIPFVMEINDLNHTGSGDFSLSLFDMILQTEATLATISYDGVTYMKNKKLTADMAMAMDMDAFKFTFKDNEFKLNQFAMGMDGWFSMPEEGFDMDLNITSKNNSFKSVLSLIPALYATDFEGLTASGSVDFNTSLKGMYTDDRMPTFTISMGIKDGRFQYPDLPTAVDNVQFKMAIDNKGGNIDNTKINISQFHIELGKNPIDATLKIDNLIDYPLDLNASANINFAEMMQLFPMEGMELKGLLDANIQAKGVYDTLTSTIPASGQFSLTNFFYSDQEYLPQGMSISTAKAGFTPESINLDAFESKVGQSDFAATGKLSNYINYALMPNEVLSGNLSLTSNTILVDEFMTTTETEAATVETDSIASEDEAYDTSIPKNINFVMDANLKKIEYDGLLLTDAKGALIIKDGVLDMKDLSTKTLGGKIVFNGVYDTKEPSAPKFDMDFGINNISIQESFKAFNTVQKLAPIAENMQGNLTTNFSMSGDLDKELMPINETVNGGGLLKIASAKLSGGKFVTALSKFTSKGAKEEMALKDINMQVKIENGVVNVAPFDVIIDGNKSTISGSTSLDGNLDYKIATSISAGQLGEQANAALNKLMGSSEKPSSSIKLNLGVTGPYDSPKVSLLGSDMKDAIKEQVTEVVVNKAADIAKEQLGVDIPTSKEEVSAKAKKEADKLLADAQKQADQVKAEAKKAAAQIRAEAQKQSDALVKEAGSNPFKKKAAEIAGKKLVDEGNKKAKQVETEGTKKADAVMNKAKEQADAILAKGE